MKPGGGDPGAREHGVDPAERLDRAGDGGVERVAVGDVGLEGDGAGAVGGDRREVAEADERHARAAGGEAAGGLGADPVGGAGDEDGLAGDHGRETSRGSSCSRTTSSTASGRHGASSSRGPRGVAGRGVVERGPDPLGDPADEPRVELARERQRRVRAGRGGGHELAAVGERLELRDPVVLAPRRADEDARAAQERPVVGAREHPREADPARPPRPARFARRQPSSSRPATTSSSPSCRAASHAASTRSSPFFSGLAPYVIAVMSRSPAAPLGSTGTGTIDRVAVRLRRLGQPALAPRHQQPRVAEAPLLHRPLPDAVPSRAVARGRRVEADRARVGRQQRRGRRRVQDRPRVVLVDRLGRRRPRRARPGELEQRVGPPLARALRGGGDDLRAGAAQRLRQLLVRLPQPRGPAQRHQQDVRPCHQSWGRKEPPKPGVRTSWIGLIGDVLST